jgi:hypothetical protein
MGFASYIISGGVHDGEEGGYAHDTVCDRPGCGADIDRGLAYLCGDSPGGGEDACGGYFCEADLTSVPGGQHGRCIPCADAIEAASPCAQADHPNTRPSEYDPARGSCACGEAMYDTPPEPAPCPG